MDPLAIGTLAAASTQVTFCMRARAYCNLSMAATAAAVMALVMDYMLWLS